MFCSSFALTVCMCQPTATSLLELVPRSKHCTKAHCALLPRTSNPSHGDPSISNSARVQAVSMRELVEATQRTRFGVNGGQSSILSGPRSWVRRLNDSLLESVSRSSPVRATPMGQS
jgi:hypothetical protein